MSSGGLIIWQPIDKHLAYTTYALVNVQKGRKADHAHYCQKCGKYRPITRVRHINRKKEKLEKIRKDERY